VRFEEGSCFAFALRVVLGCGVLAVGVAPGHAQDIAVPDLPVESYTLENGLRVRLQPDARQPRVAVAVAYDVGSRDDPPGYRGLAHLVEHLTFRGSRHLADTAAMSLVEAVGGRANAFTSADATVYLAAVPAPHLPRLMHIESQRMGFTLEALRDETFDVEVDVVLNEWRERRSVGSEVHERIEQACYPEGHPYRHLLDRYTDVDSIEVDHARYFMQRHYRPDTATLALVGAFDPEQARALIERYFGPIRAQRAAPPRPAAPAVELRGARTLRFEAPYARSMLKMRWQVPCVQARCRGELGLLRSLLVHNSEAMLPLGMGALASDLDMNLTVREALVEVELWVELVGDADRERALQRLQQTLSSLRSDPPDAQTLSTAWLGYATELLGARQSLTQRATALATGRAGGDTAELLAAVGAVQPASVPQLARRLLPADARLLVIVEASDGADRAGELVQSVGDLAPAVAGGATSP
jgi:secreted Zn-dependent insulinase-like peptidase